MLPQQDRRIRILMIDDHAVLRAGLRMIIERHMGMVVVGEAENRRETLAAIAHEAPDIILLDIEMGDANGLDAIGPIKALAAGTHVLMLTTFAMPGARERAFREGASDFMLKTWPIDEISMHIRQAMELGSVAGLLTAFLGQGQVVKEVETTEVAEKSSRFERGLEYLRGLLKFSTS